MLKLTGDFMELFIAANDFMKNDGRGAGIRSNQELFLGKPPKSGGLIHTGCLLSDAPSKPLAMNIEVIKWIFESDCKHLQARLIKTLIVVLIDIFL